MDKAGYNMINHGYIRSPPSLLASSRAMGATGPEVRKVVLNMETWNGKSLPARIFHRIFVRYVSGSSISFKGLTPTSLWDIT